MARSVLGPSDLPVLTAANRHQHHEWHAYFESVYGHEVDATVDLNRFEWFYSSAPLHLHSVLPQEHWPNEQTPPGLVFYVRSWSVRDMMLAGHFVWRGQATWRRFAHELSARSRVEVMRVGCPSEHGSAWFFPVLGTGVSLDLNTTERMPGISRIRALSRNASAAIARGHPLPELIVEGVDADFSGAGACPGSSRLHWVLPLRAGLHGRSANCHCIPSRLAINCGRFGLPAPSARFATATSGGC